MGDGVPLHVALLVAEGLLRDGLLDALGSTPGIGRVSVVPDSGAEDLLADADVLVLQLPQDAPAWDALTARTLSPGLRIVGLHSGADLDSARRAFELGVRALVPDEAGLAGLLDALVPDGWASTSLGAVAAASPLDGLEHRVLRALSLGATSRRAAGELGLTPSQFDDVKQRVFTKLGVGHQAHAVATALRLGLLDDSGGGPVLRPPVPSGRGARQ